MDGSQIRLSPRLLKKVKQLIKTLNTFFLVKKYSPSLCVFNGISILDEDSQAKIESGNRTLELLRNSIQTLPKDAIVIFTCQTIELSNLPSIITEMVHFEYVIPSLTEEDRIDFAKFTFRQKNVQNIDTTLDINYSWFANNTRVGNQSHLFLKFPF